MLANEFNAAGCRRVRILEQFYGIIQYGLHRTLRISETFKFLEEHFAANMTFLETSGRKDLLVEYFCRLTELHNEFQN